MNLTGRDIEVNPHEEPSAVATNSTRHPDRLERMLKAADPTPSGIVATPRSNSGSLMETGFGGREV
jgi:hypothetical protein